MNKNMCGSGLEHKAGGDYSISPEVIRGRTTDYSSNPDSYSRSGNYSSNSGDYN